MSIGLSDLAKGGPSSARQGAQDSRSGRPRLHSVGDPAAEAARRQRDAHEVLVAQSVTGTVDPYDAAAHLEAMGFGDGAATARGFDSTFDMAATLVRAASAQEDSVGDESAMAPGSAARWRSLPAVGRALAMLAGVLISLGTIPPNTSSMFVFVSGASSWLVCQAVSAGIWQGLGRGARDAAAVSGFMLGAVSLLVVVGLCVTLRTPLPLAWSCWGFAAAVLLTLGPLTRTVGTLVPAATVVGVLLLMGRGEVARVIAVIAIAAATVGAVLILVRGRGDRGLGLGDLGRSMTHPLVGLSLVQAAAQIGILAMLVRAVPSSGILALAMAGLAASALSEVLLDSALSWSRRGASRQGDWARLRRRTASIGLGCAASATVFGVSVGLVAGRARGVTGVALLTVGLAASLICLIAVVTGLNMRTGHAVVATLVALGALLVAALCLPLLGSTAGVGAAVAVILPVALVVAGQRTAAPSAW